MRPAGIMRNSFTAKICNPYAKGGNHHPRAGTLRVYETIGRLVCSDKAGRPVAQRINIRRQSARIAGLMQASTSIPTKTCASVRRYAALAQDTAWSQLPGGGDLLVAQEAEIMNPAPFMYALGSRDYGTGNVYEMRTYAPGDIPKVLDGWANAIAAREEFSPLAACWTSELGGLNKFVHTGYTRISTSAPASVRRPARPAVRGRRRPGCGRSGRKTSC
jgi:hypothetical protein